MLLALTTVQVLTAIVALCVVIILHELGHYLAAVWTGMKVDRFSVFGIGPTVVTLGTWRGTEFVISAIPFGAFVLIRGMEPDDTVDDAPVELDGLDDIDDDAWTKARAADRAAAASFNFRDKPVWARALVLAGGPVSNYLTAMLLFFGVYMMSGVPDSTAPIEITQVVSGKPAAEGGLQAHDQFVAIGGQPVEAAGGREGVVELLVAHPGEPLEIVVERDGETITKTITPTEEGKVGVGLAHLPRAVGMGEATAMAIERPIRITSTQLRMLYRLIVGDVSGDVQGPVRIVKHIATSIQTGLVSFLGMLALISTLLGMFNLLPLPALDGGRLTFLAYEAISRRRASARVEEMVHGYGMLALLVLIALVTVGDIRSLF